MATKGDSKTKIKSKRNLRGVGKLGWCEGGKMKNTLSKMEKAQSLEDEIIPTVTTEQAAEDIIKIEVAFQTPYKP